MTNGSLFFHEQGEYLKAFNSKDGLGIKMTMEQGYRWAVITGRSSRIVLHRMSELNIQHVFQNTTDKRKTLATWLLEQQLRPEQVLFIGDDLIDLDAMQWVGLGIAVADAHPWVKQQAHWCTSHPGGAGALREACDLLLMSTPGSPFAHWVQPCSDS